MATRGIIIVLFLAGLMFGCVILGTVSYVPEHDLVAGFGRIFGAFELGAVAVLAAASLSAAVIALAFAGRAISFWQISRQRLDQERAQTLQAQREARLIVTVADPGQQVYTHEIGGDFVITKPAHLAAGRMNGGETPDPAAVQRWLVNQLTHGTAKWSPDLPELAAPDDGSPAWPERVNLLDLLGDGPSLNHIILGVDQAGQAVAAPLAGLVHIAVGGSSGWGKSVFLRALAYQLAVAPEPVELAMVDLEGTTFAPFARSRRLRYAVADTEPGAIAILDDLAGEMDRRRGLFAAYPEADKLSAYNGLAAEPLPVIALVIDESTALLADRDISGRIRLLALRARKYGIYAILGGQDWKASSLDTAIRNQISTRVQFKAQDPTQSRILLGTGDAAGIDRVGRAMAVLPGRPLLEMQAPLISAQAVSRAVGMGPLPAPAPMVEPEPDGIEARVLELAGDGASRSAIAREVFGSDGGNQLRKIGAILDKFSPVTP
jgi:hypothetical protein